MFVVCIILLLDSTRLDQEVANSGPHPHPHQQIQPDMPIFINRTY